MISIDSSLAIQIVNFLALIFLLNILLYKPILGVIAKRKQQFAAAEGEMARLKERVDEAMAAYEAKLQQAKNEAMEQKNAIITEGAAEAAAAIAAVRDELPGLMGAFETRLEEQMRVARGTLADHSRQLSREIAEKVLGRSLP